jgi:DNA topoisomerase VI subunit A
VAKETIEVQHLTMKEGRQLLSTMDFAELGIPSVSPTLDTRWKAEFKGKFLNPGDNALFLDEVLRVVRGLSNVTTQRAVYYALRGAHPEWTYKGEPLGDAFYEHLTMWIMEKAQLKTGLTMQAMGIEAAPRGWIAGDGTLGVPRRGRVDLKNRPSLAFDIADEGVVFATRARKVIHFEKDAGLDALVSQDFPKYIEALFSTSSGQLTEAATKFLRMAEDKGLDLYAVHDGDPSGIQMQLMYGMASKNNCYMPSEFYPQMVRPLGFYPSIGEQLGLPPEAVSDKEDKIFNNLIALVNEKQRMFPELRRYGLGREVRVIVEKRQKWEFQALNAIHESAPKIYLLEGLRVHNDEIKHVPDADSIKSSTYEAARTAAATEVDAQLTALAQRLYEKNIKQALIEELRRDLTPDIENYRAEVDEALSTLDDVPAENFREAVKAEIVANPAQYAADVVKRLGKRILSASFVPTATAKIEVSLSDVEADVTVIAYPPEDREPLTKTDLVNSIEQNVIKASSTRNRVVLRIRQALEQRFGAAQEEW